MSIFQVKQMRNLILLKRASVGEVRMDFSLLCAFWRRFRETQLLKNKICDAFGMQFAWNASCQKFWIG